MPAISVQPRPALDPSPSRSRYGPAGDWRVNVRSAAAPTAATAAAQHRFSWR